MDNILGLTKTTRDFLLEDLFCGEELQCILINEGTTVDVLWVGEDSNMNTGVAVLVRFIGTGDVRLDGHLFVICDTFVRGC